MGTHYKGTKKEAAALNAFIKLMRASDSLNSRLYASVIESGLTISQFGTLETLWHLGPMCQSDIGRKLLKSGGNITMVIDNLEKRGLVKRERSKNDRRFISVHLTKKGEELISTIFPKHVQKIVKEFSVLSPEELKLFSEMCKKVGIKE